MLVTEEALQNLPSTTGSILNKVQEIREADKAEYIEIVQNVQGRIDQESVEVSAHDALDYVLRKFREITLLKTTDVSTENRSVIDEAYKKAHST